VSALPSFVRTPPAPPAAPAAPTAPSLEQAPAPVAVEAPAARNDQVRAESGAGGRYPASELAQRKLCLLSDGRLLIAHGQRLDPLVQEYEQQLKQQRFKYTIEAVNLSELREHYTLAAQQGAVRVAQATDSERQQKVMQLVQHATRMGASDMHFIIGRDLGEIRYRINGLLETPPGNQMQREEVSQLLATIYLSMLDAAGDTVYNAMEPQDGRVDQKFLHHAGLHGIRTATRPTDRGQIGILRLLYGGKRRQLDQLGYLPEQCELARRMAHRRVGINILSGPTGSGKSTTLSAVFEMQVEAFKNQLHILTIEDPPETIIEGCNHTPVDRENGDPAWAASIKNAMRLDPDVIGIGEMRDKPSAIAAFQAAMTGHAVWTTLHANDSFAIVQRLLELGVDASLVMDPAILGMLGSQNLAPTLCEHCKAPWHARPANYDAGTAARLETVCDTSKVYVAVGCDRCRSTGAGGRTLLAELVETDLDLFRVYRKEGKAEARATWIEKGGVTKTAHLIQRIEEGLIDPIHAEAAVNLLDHDRLTVSRAHRE
jgi:general secretion pathway protein E